MSDNTYTFVYSGGPEHGRTYTTTRPPEHFRIRVPMFPSASQLKASLELDTWDEAHEAAARRSLSAVYELFWSSERVGTYRYVGYEPLPRDPCADVRLENRILTRKIRNIEQALREIAR